VECESSASDAKDAGLDGRWRHGSIQSVVP
jgi:hypothetical protein